MNDMLPQHEIDAMIQQSQMQPANEVNGEADLSANEIDALGEIGNISMGAAATALYTIISRSVVITTPEVSITSMSKLGEEQIMPYVVVVVEYTEGFAGNNLYALRVDDVKAITDIMMGGSGIVSEEELSELHISAISEAMNQMMGGMATSLAEMFDRVINISPPKSMVVRLADDRLRDIFKDTQARLIQIRFSLEIEGLKDSSIVQLIPLEFGKQLVKGLLSEQTTDVSKDLNNSSANITDSSIKPDGYAIEQMGSQQHLSQTVQSNDSNDHVPKNTMPQRQLPVDIRPIQLNDFDHQEDIDSNYENSIDIILDVPLQVSVELGQSRKTIKDVMDLNIGSVVALDRVAGEPVDVVVNGKVVARGEVIVIDDNYGIRITEVITSSRVRTAR